MAAWLSDEPGEPAVTETDRCPYSRSFSPAFAEDPSCPAYQASTFTVLDAADRPLRPGLTCRHLTVGTHQRHGGRFYPRCGLGSAAQRLRWVAGVTPARLAVMRSVEEEFDSATLATRTELSVAKAQLVRHGSDADAVEELERRLGGFLDDVDDFIEARAARLNDVGLQPALMKQLLAEWSMAWLRSSDVYGPGTETLEDAGLSRATAALLGAELGEARDVPGTDEVVNQSAQLVITRREQPPTLHLRGEIDVSNSDSLAAALANAMAGGSSVSVDFAEVLFCDLSGLRALVRAAQATVEGQRIEVVGLPSHVHHALRAVGWWDLPGLVIEPPPSSQEVSP